MRIVAEEWGGCSGHLPCVFRNLGAQEEAGTPQRSADGCRPFLSVDGTPRAGQSHLPAFALPCSSLASVGRSLSSLPSRTVFLLPLLSLRPRFPLLFRHLPGQELCSGPQKL